jgi:hypothetical protein
MIAAGVWPVAVAWPPSTCRRTASSPPSLTCATTLLAPSRTLSGNAELDRMFWASCSTGAAVLLVTRCACSSCPCSVARADRSAAVTAVPVPCGASFCNVARATVPTVRSRSFARSCSSWVICLPRTASWVVRPKPFAAPTASATRSPPKTRPVTLAAMKTATSRVDTGQLLSASRFGRPTARLGLGLVCRPAPVFESTAWATVISCPGPAPPAVLVGAPDNAGRPPRHTPASASGPFIALPSPLLMSQPQVNIDMSQSRHAAGLSPQLCGWLARV